MGVGNADVRELKELFEKVYSPCLLLFTTTYVLERVALSVPIVLLLDKHSNRHDVLRTVPDLLVTGGISTVHQLSQKT